MTNLDELEQLLAQATPGELWQGDGSPQSLYHGDDAILQMRPPDDVLITTHPAIVAMVNALGGYRELAALIVALHNSAPALLAELKAARAVCEAANALVQRGVSYAHDPDCATRHDGECTCGLEELAYEYRHAAVAWQKARGEG